MGFNLVQRAILNPEALKKRFQELGWSYYRLAKEVVRIRADLYGDLGLKPNGMGASMKNALENPSGCDVKTLECIVKAMDGDLKVAWRNQKTVIVDEVVEEDL